MSAFALRYLPNILVIWTFFVHFSDYFPKQKIVTSFAYNLQVTPDKIESKIHCTPPNKADGLFGFVHSWCLVLLVFWNARAKLFQGLCAIISIPQLNLVSIRRNWSMRRPFQFITEKMKQILVTIVLISLPPAFQ